MNRLKQTGMILMAFMLLAPLPAMAASAVEINAKVTAALADF